jgi:hypothetical protein
MVTRLSKLPSMAQGLIFHGNSIFHASAAGRGQHVMKSPSAGKSQDVMKTPLRYISPPLPRLTDLSPSDHDSASKMSDTSWIDAAYNAALIAELFDDFAELQALIPRLGAQMREERRMAARRRRRRRARERSMRVCRCWRGCWGFFNEEG